MASTDVPLTPFRHGVASFDPVAHGVLLWTRVDAPPGTEVRWCIGQSTDGRADVEGVTVVPDDADGCITVDVDGLEAASTYHYWFEVDGVLSPVGRTRTLPEAHTPWFRLAVVCCADRSMGTLDAYRAIAEDEVDVVLHLGDYLYEEAKGPHPVDPPGTTITLEDYRRRHAHTRLDPDLIALHLRHPMIFVWDDHDVADNAWRHGAKAHDPDEHGPWEERLAAATKARDEWLPARLRNPADRLAMWRSFPIGDLAELVVTDTRIPGRDRQYGDGTPDCLPLDDPERSLLGDAQRRWLHERVHDTTRPWCIVASQVPVANLDLPIPRRLGDLVSDLMPSGYDIIDGQAVCTDLWEGYPLEQEALRQAIEERGEGVLVVSGDVHSNWVTRLRGVKDDDLLVAAELVVTSVSSTPMGDQLPPGWRKEAERIADRVPHQVWHDLEHHGYLRIDVRPDAARGDFIAVDPGWDHPERLVSYEVARTSALGLRKVSPDVPPEAAADAVRPGLPLDRLPAHEPAAPPPPNHYVKRVAVAGTVAAALVLVGRRLVLSRR